MKIFVDIDKTICEVSENLNYEDAQPIDKNIRRINELFDLGHIIVYWTARGSVTGINWKTVTENQFKKWGVKYHELRFGKPDYDLFICDKAINSEDFFKDI